MAASGLAHVREAIAAAARSAGQEPSNITLVAVSKGRSDEEVSSVAAEGQRVFGENRQQGLAARLTASLPSDIAWHFIGPLQSRKAQRVAADASLLQSMDRYSLAQKWEQSGTTPVLVQFNMAGEPQKSGFDPTHAHDVISKLLEMDIAVSGVMAIPPFAHDPDDSREHFVALRSIFDMANERLAPMVHCSMGMSGDYVAAIAEGSTMVRVGRAIFEPTDI